MVIKLQNQELLLLDRMTRDITVLRNIKLIGICSLTALRGFPARYIGRLNVFSKNKKNMKKVKNLQNFFLQLQNTHQISYQSCF